MAALPLMMLAQHLVDAHPCADAADLKGTANVVEGDSVIADQLASLRDVAELLAHCSKDSFLLVL
jgi:hypothetical protein